MSELERPELSQRCKDYVAEAVLEQWQESKAWQARAEAAEAELAKLQNKVAFLTDLNHKRHNVSIDELQAENARLKEAANWVLYVANGIGQSGGQPKAGEYEAAMNALKESVADEAD